MAQTQVQVESPIGAARPATPSSARLVSMLVFAAVLAAWVITSGPPKQVVQVFGWIWLATIAWNIRAPWRAHLAFPRDWSLPLLVLIAYLFSRGLADEIGFVSVHVTEPIAADRWLFGGTLPTEYLQANLCGVPCERTMPPEWYDVVLTTVYYSHFVVALTIAAVLWVRNRTVWAHYLRRYLTLNVLALAIYVTYPMAPPWLASEQGVVTSDIARLTARGWYDLREVDFHQRISAVGNPVAAMPSLHAAIALFVALYAIHRWSRPQRWLVLLYPLAMSFMLVYYAEHYVVDLLAGYVVVGVAWWGCSAWERLRRAGPSTPGA